MGDFIPHLEEGEARAKKTRYVYDALEKIIKYQFTEEKSVGNVLTGLGTPFVSVGILDTGHISAAVLGSPNQSKKSNLHDGNSSNPARSLDKETLFQAASISKAITALAVIKLCQLGKLDLDATISQYLSPKQMSWISTASTKALIPHISLRLLLSHTSGLGVHGFEGYPAATGVPTISEILCGNPPANNEQISLNNFPGQKFSYSGGGFVLIQLILETQLQKPFHEIMRDIVLEPLQMSRSTYDDLSDREKNYAPAYVSGKLASNPDYHFYPEKAPAGLWTTPTDLLRAVSAVQRSLEADDFLERSWAETMLTEVGQNTIGMALGWVTDRGNNTINHNGSSPPGHTCMIFGYANLSQFGPKQKAEVEKRLNNSIPKTCGICVMTSSALGFMVILKILEAITYLKGWSAVSDAPMVPFLDRERAIDVQAENWCGDWGPGAWNISKEEGKLAIRYDSLPAFGLTPGVVAPHTYDEGNSVDLVVDGLNIMVRLGWKDGSRIIEMWQNGVSTVLRRKV